jgi:2-succinyl-5-enolpyruvyl-6-hydroxy-3-cyclohexene-1-carboxylate synthase
MIADAPNINSLWARLVVEELTRNGVTGFHVSPGSRSAPLALAAAEHPQAHCRVHFDERGAAYHALGHAAASRRPAVLICTSGTAVANYFPAVMEASSARIPLLLLTADRPPELLAAGANQTVDQSKLFGTYARWEMTLPAPSMEAAPEAVLTTVDQAVYRCLRAPAGPVHLNCMFREPLAPLPTGQDFRTYLSSVRAWSAGTRPYSTYGGMRPGSDPTVLKECLARIDSTRHGLLVVGRLETHEESDAILKLARALNWPTLPDVTSGLRLGDIRAPLIHYFDQLLTSERYRRLFRPQTILHLGGAVTSKRYLRQLETSPPLNYIQIVGHPLRQDPAHRVTLRGEMEIAGFCGSITPAVTRQGEDSWLYAFRRASMRVKDLVQEFVDKDSALTEIAIAQLVSRHLHEGDILYLGNSMPIRDMDMFGFAGGAPVRVAANRGASGIDGSIATPVGWADGSGRPVTALIGDLAALHDLNSFALAPRAAAPVVFVVVNNNGGGIFHFLPVAAFPEHFEQSFGTPHGFRFDCAAEMFGLEYANPRSKAEFVDAYQAARERGAPAIIEVNTDRAENLRVHKALQSAIVQALDSGEF